MSTKRSVVIKKSLVIGTLVLAAASMTYSGGLPSSVRVVSTHVSGAVVEVSVLNPSDTPANGTVAVRASVAGVWISAVAPVSLAAHETAVMRFDFSGPVTAATALGCTTDEPVPF